MPESFTRLFSEPTIVQSQHVAYSVDMVSAIAANFDAGVDALSAVDASLGPCMLDAFYVHIRLLADLLVRPTGAKDFGPADFVVEWTPPLGICLSEVPC